MACEPALDGAILDINLAGRPLITKPFEPNEMQEVLADMLGLPQGWPLHEHLGSGLRH